MYVCLCNGLTERDVTSCARETGLRCPTRVYEKLGAEPQCGRCLDFAAELIAPKNDVAPLALQTRRRTTRTRELSTAA